MLTTLSPYTRTHISECNAYESSGGIRTNSGIGAKLLYSYGLGRVRSLHSSCIYISWCLSLDYFQRVSVILGEYFERLYCFYFFTYSDISKAGLAFDIFLIVFGLIG